MESNSTQRKKNKKIKKGKRNGVVGRALPSNCKDGGGGGGGGGGWETKNSIIILLYIFQTSCWRRHSEFVNTSMQGGGTWKLGRL